MRSVDVDLDDGESFFVAHGCFIGGNDPPERLETALKADIHADAWASPYATVSRPFNTPITQRIAGNVINAHGDEVMQVFSVS